MNAAWRDSYGKLLAACLFLNGAELGTLLTFVVEKIQAADKRRQAAESPPVMLAGSDRGAPEYHGQVDVPRLAANLAYTSGLLTAYRCGLDDESLAESISRLEKEMVELGRLIQPNSPPLVDPLAQLMPGPDGVQ